MIVDAVDIKLNKKDAIKYLKNKMPLMSRVVQFNNISQEIHIEYIEFKVISYEIITKTKLNNFLNYKPKSDKFISLINTYNGCSECIKNIPNTSKKYISKSYIKKNKLKEEDILYNTKNNIIFYLKEKSKDNIDKLNIKDINILNIKSIYKPYWISNYKGKDILIDA